MKRRMTASNELFSNLSLLYPAVRLLNAIGHSRPYKSVLGICLEGDTTLRLETTISLYRKNIINRVIVSGGVAQDEDRDELPARKMYEILTSKGIPPAFINLDEQSLTTHDHPLYVLDLVRGHGVMDLMIITSGHHLVRAYLRFLRVIVDEHLPINLYGYAAGSFTSWFRRIPRRGPYRISIFLFKELYKIRTYYGLASLDEAFAYLRSRE